MNAEEFQKLTESLRKIFDEECLMHFATGQDNTQVTLKEAQKNAKLKEVRIIADSQKIFAIQLDIQTNVPICKYFSKSTKKINQICDFLIFTIFNDTPYMLFVEMKSEAPKGFREQFHNSLLFVEYIKIILKEYYDCDCSGFKSKLFLFYYRKSSTNEAIIDKFSAKAITNKFRELTIRKKSFSKDTNYISLQELLLKHQ